MKVEQAIKKITDLYKDVGWKKWFIKFHFWEENYLEVEKLLPKQGVIVDLGCAEGAFANFLALTSEKRRIIGFEIDQNRVKIANRGIRNTDFRRADVVKLRKYQADAIVIYHVLHHLRSREDQIKVLENCRKNLVKGGKLIVVEVEVKPSLKYLAAWMTDVLLVPWVFEKRLFAQIFFRSSKDWSKVLTELGFSCKIIRAEKGKPFPNVILDCNLK